MQPECPPQYQCTIRIEQIWSPEQIAWVVAGIVVAIILLVGIYYWNKK